MNQEQGFTMIEILLVVSLIFILSSTFSWNIGNFSSYFRLQSDLRQMYHTFMQARQLTILKQKEYGILFKASKNSYYLYSEKEGIIKTNQLKKGIKFNKIKFGGDNKMTFKPIGTAEGGSISLENKNNLSYKITVYSHTGRIRYIK